MGGTATGGTAMGDWGKMTRGTWGKRPDEWIEMRGLGWGAIGQGRHDQDDAFCIELIGLFIAWVDFGLGGFWLGWILAWGDIDRGDFVWRDFVWGDFGSGGFCPGGFCPGGFVQGGFCPGEFCPGGFCPGGFCPGGFCPVTTNLLFTKGVTEDDVTNVQTMYGKMVTRMVLKCRWLGFTM